MECWTDLWNVFNDSETRFNLIAKVYILFHRYKLEEFILTM